MTRFEHVNADTISRTIASGAFRDRIVFQMAPWISFLADTQKGEPVFAVLRHGDQIIGCFTGLVIRKFGLKILGSPFRGWSTPLMGFNLLPSTKPRLAVKALFEFAFDDLKCDHLELVDPHVKPEDIEGLGATYEKNPTVIVDITRSDEELLASFDKHGRRAMRKAEKIGAVSIEESNGLDFANDYFAQLKDVFGKQKLSVPWGIERVRALIQHMGSTGMLLLLRARDPQGKCIATGIFPALNETMHLWGNASFTADQNLYPNELLHWHAMKFWRDRGIKKYDMTGNSRFKLKFGGTETYALLIRKSKNRLISVARQFGPQVARAFLRLRWKFFAGN